MTHKLKQAHQQLRRAIRVLKKVKRGSISTVKQNQLKNLELFAENEKLWVRSEVNKTHIQSMLDSARGGK